MDAVHSGMTVYFTSMDRLLADLEKAQKEGKLERRWKVYQRPSILMIDEVGYTNLNRLTGNLFFQLVCMEMKYRSGDTCAQNSGFPSK